MARSLQYWREVLWLSMYTSKLEYEADQKLWRTVVFAHLVAMLYWSLLILVSDAQAVL